MDTQKSKPKLFSMEFFPPRNVEAEQTFSACLENLLPLNPDFCSVTFGAAGSTREKTHETVSAISQQYGLDVAPHISCIASSRDSIREMLKSYRESGVRRLVALRGDMPSGMLSAGEFRYANELVAFIREETGLDFHIEVAAYPEMHPQASSLKSDLENFKRKVSAGANSAITQYFFTPEAYFRFIDDCEKLGIDIPIVPGIMPLTNHAQIARFSEMCGADIPRWIKKRLEGFGDDRTAIRAFGLDVVTGLCERLLEQGAPGLHFYTLNQSKPVLKLWENLGIRELIAERT